MKLSLYKKEILKELNVHTTIITSLSNLFFNELINKSN